MLNKRGQFQNKSRQLLGFEPNFNTVSIVNCHLRHYHFHPKLENNQDKFSGLNPPKTQPTCAARWLHRPCFQIRNRRECLTSKDNRSAHRNQNCVWCLPSAHCPHGNVCEPQNFLQGYGKRAGRDFETCFIEN